MFNYKVRNRLLMEKNRVGLVVESGPTAMIHSGQVLETITFRGFLSHAAAILVLLEMTESCYNETSMTFS